MLHSIVKVLSLVLSIHIISSTLGAVSETPSAVEVETVPKHAIWNEWTVFSCTQWEGVRWWGGISAELRPIGRAHV